MSAGSLERQRPPLGRPGTGAGRWAAVPSPLRRGARHLLSAGVLAAGGYFAAIHARDLRAAAHLLAGLRWPWICAAVVCEAGSMLVLARLQRRLLRAGGVRIGLRTMLGVTVAANAMDATLPGGVAWSAAWVFSQLSRHGVPRMQRVWMFLAAGAVSSFTLFAVVAAGVEIAGGTGPMAGFRALALILAAIPVAVAGCQLLRRVPHIRRGWRTAGQWLAARSPAARRLQTLLSGFLSRLTTVRLTPGGWADALAMGLANWLLDAAVLVAVLKALDIRVPWHALLVIYGMTQVAVSLPVTPGGLGVVEGSLAGLLAAYGTGGGQALAAVMAYRAVSFWIMVPAGWLVWLYLSFRRSRHPSVHPAHAGRVRTTIPGRLRRALGRPDLAGAAVAALSGAALLALPGSGVWSAPGLAFQPVPQPRSLAAPPAGTTRKTGN